MKKQLLSILGLVLLGITSNAQTISYSNDFTSAPTVTGSGDFTYGGDGNNWTITAAGTKEWESFYITFNNPINFSTPGTKPILSLIGTSTQNVAFTVVLMDTAGRATDNPAVNPPISGPLNTFNILKDQSAKSFTYDFTGQFKDNFGGPNGQSGKGKVDSTQIKKIRFSVNSGWATSPYTYHRKLADSNDYKTSLNGTIKIDKLQIGAALSVGIAKIDANDKFSVYPNPSTGLVSVSLNNPNSDFISVLVANVLGQEIYSGKTNESNLSIDLSGKEKGLYYISIKSEQGITTKRLFLN